MKNLSFERRKYDCFVSYGSEEHDIAKRVADFIESSGLKVFFDSRSFSAASEVDEGLAQAMSDSKSCILLLSNQSIQKPYVLEEIRLAKHQAVMEPEFRLIAAVLEERFVPSEFVKGLAVRSWLSLPNGEITTETAKKMLLSLRTPESLPHRGQPHIYVSCSWRDSESHPRDLILSAMKSRGAFLIGDSRDQRTFQEDGPDRIRRIMAGCSGFLAIYPDRREPGKSSDESYKYFLTESEIARELELTSQVYCVNLDSLPTSLRKKGVVEWKSDSPGPVFENQLESFLDDAGTRQPHSFLATDFKRSLNRNEAAKQIIESLLGMHCHLGKEILGADLRNKIRQIIREANLIIADLGCSVDEKSKELQINVNTCIEAGIAFAHQKPLFLTALDPTVGRPDSSKTKSIPFFFRDHSIEWYRDDASFLANIFRIAFNRRRRVINDELPD